MRQAYDFPIVPVSKMHYSNLMSGFTKLFSTIIHSTVWREDMHVKVVWVTMLAMADRNGCVFASIPGLADAAKVSLPQCLDALEKLSSPDEYSRTKDHEGKRIAVCDGGWELLNYQKYRETRNSEERRIQNREAVRRHRTSKTITVSRRKQCKPVSAQAEAEAEAEAKREKKTRTLTPKERAGAFCEWYADTHERLFGIGYMGTNLDYQKALELCAKFTDQQMRDAALVWFGDEDKFATNGTRSVPKFASRITGYLQTIKAKGIA